MKKGIFILSLFMSVQVALATTHHSTYHTKKYIKKHAKGLKISQKMQATPLQYFSAMKMDVSLPQSVDLSSLVSLPENQGACGACWAFALTKTLRSQYMLAGKDPGTLEFNYLLNNCGPGPEMDGCNGGSFEASASFLSGAGPGLNSLDPYHAKTGKCKHLPVKATAVSALMVGTPHSGPTFKDLAYLLGGEVKHMVAIDVAAGMSDWESYSDGIYNDCQGTANDIDHMISLVGYDCETSVDSHNDCVFDSEGKPIHGDGYLLVQNNWGEEWGTEAMNGHGGYMKTRMYGENGSKCNAIANDALIFKVASPPLPVAEQCSGFLCSLLGCDVLWCHS